MEWDEKLQSIIDYVEYHLQRKEEPVDNDQIAKMAGCSFDFFQKVFSYMNGISWGFPAGGGLPHPGTVGPF